MTKFLELFVKIISVVSLLLIIAGNFYSQSYFQNFEIDIYEYISPSEVLGFFLSSLLRIILIIISVFLPFAIMILVAREGMILKAKKRNSYFGKLRIQYSWYTTVGSWITVILIVTGFILFQLSKSAPNELYTYNAYILRFASETIRYFIVVSGLCLVVFRIWRKQSIRNGFIIMVFVFTLTSLLVIRNAGSLNAHLTMMPGNESVYKVYDFGSQKIRTNDTLKYIGSTREYFFFCSIKHDLRFSTYVFKKSDLVSPIIFEYENPLIP